MNGYRWPALQSSWNWTGKGCTGLGLAALRLKLPSFVTVFISWLRKAIQGLALNLLGKGHYYYHHLFFMLNIGHFMDIHRHWALDEIVNQGHFETFFRGIDIWPRPRLPASSHALILITWSLIGSLSQCCPIIDCHCEMFTCFQIVLSCSSVPHTLKYLLSLKIVSRNCLNLQ